MKLINIGFGNIISVERVVSIVSPDSAPIKRMVQEAKDNTHNTRYKSKEGGTDHHTDKSIHLIIFQRKT